MSVSLPAGYSLVALDGVDSTNEEAKRRAEAGAPEGTVIWALEQTAGRGRRSRPWESRRGNLFVSVLLRPGKPASELAQLSFVAAVAMAEALQTLLPSGAIVQCKWPNDVLVNGRKISGILLESSGIAGASGVDWIVIGCGVNVNSHPDDVDYPTTDLAAENCRNATAQQLLELFLHRLAVWRARWLDDGIGPVRDAWVAKAARLGETISVRLPKRNISGRFLGLDETGALLLEMPGGARETIAAGDVYS